MFTGIIEAMGRVDNIRTEGGNKHITISCPFTPELQVDQSVAHNGVCLTVVNIEDNAYTVTAIEETLNCSMLGSLAEGDVINLERCTKVGDRLDGHIVQGHVDQTATVTNIAQHDGSWIFRFSYDAGEHITVPKGSITINGVSLTVVDSDKGSFSVAIIPYTYEHTNFNTFKVGTVVNLEFDIVGKYVARLLAEKQ